MAFNLRKLAERAIAQANPFDGGKTAATVARAQAQQAPPARTPAQVPQRPAVAQRQAPSPSNNALLRGVSRGWNQINMLDNGRTWVNPTPTSDMSVKQQATRLAVDNVAKPIARSANTLAGAAVKGAQQSADIVNLGRESLLGTDNSYQQALNRATQRSNAPIQFSNNGGLLGAGTHFKTAQELDNPVKLASAAVTTGSDLASFVAPSMSLKAGFQQGGKTLVTKLVGANALDNAVNNVASQVNETGRVDPRGVAVSAALGVGMPVAGYGVGRAAKGVVDAGIAATRLVRNKGIKAPSPLNPSEVADLSNFRQVAGTGAIMDEGVYQRGVQAAQKAGIDYRDPTQVDNLLGAHRTFDTRLAQRNEALQRFKPQPLNEGGFAKVPSVDRNELQKIYRGQDTDKLDFSSDRIKLTPDYRGVAFSSDLEMAKPYGKNIVERYIPKNRVLKAKDIPAKDLEKLRNDWKRMSGVDDNNPFSGNDNDLFQQEYEINKILKIAQDQGKDAVDVADIYPFVAPEAEIRVINPGALQDLSKPTKNKLGLTKLNEGGYARIPGGTKDPAPDLSPQQKTFVNEYANMLKDMGQGNGVDIGVDGQRLSNNFRAPELKGKNMTEYDWFQQARKELESGKGAYGASEEYAKLANSSTGQAAMKNQEIKSNQKLQTNPENPNIQKYPTAQSELSQLPSSYQDQRTTSPVSSTNSATKQLDSKDWGNLMRQVDEEMPFDQSVARTARSKETKKLAEAINKDQRITKAAQEAQVSGKELNFYAKKDKNGRTVGIEQFDPSNNRIEAGFVVDKNGNNLGNHIKVDGTGIQVNVGGELTNLSRIIGNPNDWKGAYRPSETMSRNIDRVAPTKEIAAATKDFVIGNKVQAEAKYRTEVQAEYNALGKRIDEVTSARPKSVSKKQYDDDVFAVLNGDKTDVDIRKAYDKPAADAILKYKTETRALYDTLLERINNERVKFGQAPIGRRNDYITHLQELSGDQKFTGEVYNAVKNSFTEDGMARTRGGVPASISGRTENFKPVSAWNKYLQERKGTSSLRDPYKAVEAYIEPALYNIHMTESTVRARALESAFRTADEIARLSPENAAKEAGSILKQYSGQQGNAKMTDGLAEYANALARKTQRTDRQILDMSQSTALGLRGWQQLQRIGGRGTILGNASSVLAQPLNQGVGIADAGVANWFKGIAKTIGGDDAIKQSPFITARRTKADAPLRSKGEKVLDAGGYALQEAEYASIKIIWNSQHAKALQAGKKGMEAIREADYNTERLVAGRGIADKPELYRSTLANGFLQYTLEVNAQWKAVMKDFTPKQKVTFAVAALGINTVMGAVTGFEPLPDPLGAAIDTGADYMDKNDKRSGTAKAIGGAQRFADQYVKANPIASAGVNTFLNQQQRQAIFGKDAQTSQFEGVAAPVQVARNAADALIQASKGNFGSAGTTAIKNLPFGNQARKTIQGAGMINRGYAVDSSGNPTYAAPSSLAGKAQALIFGAGSTSEARKYYDNDQSKISSSADLARIRNSSDKRKTVDELQNARQEKKDSKDGTIPTELQKDYEKYLKNKLTPVQDKLMQSSAYKEMSPADQKKALDLVTKKYTSAYKREYMAEKNIPISKQPSKSDERIITGKTDVVAESKSSSKKTSKPSEKDYYKVKDAEYKDFKNKYEADKKAGKLTQLQDLERSKKLQKLEIGSKYDKEARDLWGKSKAIVSQYINSQPPDKAKSLTDQLTAYDRELYEAGLAKYATFKNGIAPVGRGRRTGSGRRSGGRRTARGGKRGGRGKKASGGVSKASLKQYMLSDITKQRGAQYKKLSDIVKRATISSKSSGSATGKKVALKKYTPKKGTVKRGNI